MNNGLKITLGVVTVGVAGFLAVVAMQPAQVHIERSVRVAAAPGDVFPLVNDYAAFLQWNPWMDLDPSQKTVLSEPSAGVGAWYTWEGNDQVGKGKMTHTAAVQDERVVSALEFLEPFPSKATVTLALAPDGDHTRVTWGFDSENDFMGKAFSLFVDMDAMLGADFEKGLGRLKPLAEAAAAKRVEAQKQAEADAAAAQAALAEATPEAAPAASP